jgi:hypothetical protein
MNPDPPRGLIQTLEALLPDHARSRRILEEAGAHFQDCVEALTQQGLSAEKANAEAARRFGDPELVANQVKEIIIMEQDTLRRRMALLTVTPSILVACLFAITMTVMSALFHPRPAYLAVVAVGALVVLGACGLSARQVFSSRTDRGPRASSLRLASLAAGAVGVAVCVGTAIRTVTTGDGDGYVAVGGVGIVAAAIAGFLLAEYDRRESREPR